MKESSYWLDVPLLKGNSNPPQDGEVLIIGSGFSGLSAAYWLLKYGIKDITIVDKHSEEMATTRNCAHILHGTVESMLALKALQGEEKAREIWSFSIELCKLIKETIRELKIDCEYKQDGYYVIAVNEVENKEIIKSVEILNKMGFQSDYLDASQIQKLKFKNCLGARYEKESASAHPVKFRNGLLSYLLSQGVKYHSNVNVIDLYEDSEHAIIQTSHSTHRYSIAILAANAYSPLLNAFIRDRKMIEPFKGQIMTTNILKHKFATHAPHSFDHGYIYALPTKDNRLMIGGWRNHVKGKEVGTYSLDRNLEIENGLLSFVKEHYEIGENIYWDYSWTGIMGASQTGFPFIGPIGLRLFTCSAYTGHGFSWAHGSAQLLAKMICGKAYDKNLASYFNPMKV